MTKIPQNDLSSKMWDARHPTKTNFKLFEVTFLGHIFRQQVVIIWEKVDERFLNDGYFFLNFKIRPPVDP